MTLEPVEEILSKEEEERGKEWEERGEEEDPYSLFIYGMRSPKTKEKCIGRLRMFFDSINITEGSMERRSLTFFKKAKQDHAWVYRSVIQYLQKQKERYERKEIGAGTLKNRFQAIKLFCEMNDIDLPWKKVSKGLPRARKYAEDRSPTLEEIRKIIEYPDRRIKAIVYTTCSSGIRVGAWDYIKWKHITPVENSGDIIAGRLVVYAGEEEEYFTFITPEAYLELQKWKEYRKQSGEPLTEDSWVMRQIWNTKKGYTRGLACLPRKLESEGVKRLVEDALWTQGIRKKLELGKKRHEFQTDHGFRKFHETRCLLSGVKLINVKILQDQSVGISDSYYRPTENELLEDYLKAVPFLTISSENQLKLEKQEAIESQKQNQDRLTTIEEQYIMMQSQMQSLITALKKMEGQGKNEFAKNLFLSGIFKKE